MQVLNVVRFLRSKTGRELMVPPLSVAEVATAGHMENELKHIKRQFFQQANASKQNMPSPAELVSSLRWVPGGWAALMKAANERAARLCHLVPTVQAQVKGSAEQINLATKLNGSMLTMLQTGLPPQRPRSLYTLRLSGVLGVADRLPACQQCKRFSCKGNTLVREGSRRFRYIISHHKCERSKGIPDQELRLGLVNPAVLDVLESVSSPRPPPQTRRVNNKH